MANESDSMVKSFCINGGIVKKLPAMISCDKIIPSVPKYIPRDTVKMTKKQLSRAMRNENKKVQAQARAIIGSKTLMKVSKSKLIVEEWLRSGKELPNTKYDKGTVKAKKRVKKEFAKYRRNSSESFYTSDAWRTLRYQALKLYGRVCLVCGATPPAVVLHVDHIKPRSKFPELELDITNLQILCADCNLGKSNKDSIDWR